MQECLIVLGENTETNSELLYSEMENEKGGETEVFESMTKTVAVENHIVTITCFNSV